MDEGAQGRRGDAEGRRRVLGILGGMGPHAHVAFERGLLARCAAERDQDYPPWVVLSAPGIPDRTEAVFGRGPSPGPALLRGLERLATMADVAVVACNTAHAFLPRGSEPLPLLRLPEETVRGLRPGQGVGILATTGTLHGGIYPAARGDLSWVSLLDLPGGDALQEDLVMRPIYGAPGPDGRPFGGIKAGAEADPLTGRPHEDALQEAAQRLFDAGAEVVLAACTEIPLALPRSERILDPMWETAGAALRWLGYPVR